MPDPLKTDWEDRRDFWDADAINEHAATINELAGSVDGLQNDLAGQVADAVTTDIAGRGFTYEDNNDGTGTAKLGGVVVGEIVGHGELWSALVGKPRYDITDHGIVGDGGITDNIDALEALLAMVPEGSEIFSPNPTDYYGISRQWVIDKSVTFSGHWNRGTISGPLAGSVIGPTDAAAQLAMESLVKITSSRVTVDGIALLGIPTKETAGTVSINGTTAHLSSLTATSDYVGARVSGPNIPVGTVVSSVNTGANTVTLSKTIAGTPVWRAFSDSSKLTVQFTADHDLSVGDTLTLSGFTPLAYNGTWTIATVVDWQTVQITSTANPGNTTIVGSYTAQKSGCEIWFGADGLELDTDVEQVHYCDFRSVHIEGFGQGASMGLSDHITFKDCEITSCYDGVAFLPTNQFDYSFNNTLLVGNTRSGLHIGKDASVVGLSLTDGCHLGWSEYGIFQDITANGNGVNGLSMVHTPIEHISNRHIRLAYGGAIEIDPACYWTWTDGTPHGPAFSISEEQNYGNVIFKATLAGYTNNNCPYLFYAGAQTGGRFYMQSVLGDFAESLMGGNARGPLQIEGLASVHSADEDPNGVITGAAGDLLIRTDTASASANSWIYRCKGGTAWVPAHFDTETLWDSSVTLALIPGEHLTWNGTVAGTGTIAGTPADHINERITGKNVGSADLTVSAGAEYIYPLGSATAVHSIVIGVGDQFDLKSDGYTWQRLG